MDFQKMNGKKDITIPIIFSGTGGLALISIDLVKKKTSIDNVKGNQIFILNPKKKLFQILNESNQRILNNSHKEKKIFMI